MLLRTPGFLAVAAAASLIQGSHALYYGFTTLDWQAAGFGGGSIGLLWGLGVLAEIALFACSARLPAAFTPAVLILIGATGAVIRWLAMGFGPPDALLPLLQCLHGLSFGATALGGMFFGRLADRYGRKPVLMATILTYSAGVFLSGLSPSVAWLAAFRILTGLGVGGEWATGLSAQRAPSSCRGRSGGSFRRRLPPYGV